MNVAQVLKTFKENAHRAVDMILAAVPKIAARNWDAILQEHEVYVVVMAGDCPKHSEPKHTLRIDRLIMA